MSQSLNVKKKACVRVVEEAGGGWFPLSEPTCNIDRCAVANSPQPASRLERCCERSGLLEKLPQRAIDRFQPEPQHPRVEVVSKQSLVCMSGRQNIRLTCLPLEPPL